MTDTLCLGIDVGGSSTKIGLVSLCGAVKAHAVLPHALEQSPEMLAGNWLSWADQASGLDRVSHIGAALPGHITQDGNILERSNVPVLDGFPLKVWLENKAGKPTKLLNDATAAGFGELSNLSRPFARFLMVTLGTGVGVAFFVDGVSQTTINETLGDIGHIIVRPGSTLRCQMGCTGCLETVASAQYLTHAGRAIFPDMPPDQVVKTTIEGFRAGQADCEAIFETMAGYIGMALASWTHQFRPDQIAIGGGLSQAGPRLLYLVRAAFEAAVMTGVTPRPKIHLAQTGNLAGLIGAANCVRAATSRGALK